MNAQITKRPLIMRMLAMLLSVLTMLSGFLTMSFSANAADQGYVIYNDNYHTGYKFANRYSMRYTAGTTTYNVSHSDYPITVYKPDNTISYCIAPGAPLYSAVNNETFYLDKNDQGSVNYWEDLKKSNAGLERGISLVLYYGYGGRADKTGVKSSNTRDDRYVATQILVWELINGERDGNDFSTNGLNPTKMVAALSKPHADGFYSAYGAIVDACRKFVKVPNFAVSEKLPKSAKTYTLKYNSSSNQYTYTTSAADSDVDLSKYTWSAGSGIQVKQNGQKLVLTSNAPVSGVVTVKGTRNKDDNTPTNDMIWGKWSVQLNPVNGWRRSQVLLSTAKVDPLNVMFKVQTENVGNLKIEKIYKDENEKSQGHVDEKFNKNTIFLLKQKGSNRYVTVTATSSNGTDYKFNSITNTTDPAEAYKNQNYHIHVSYTGSSYTANITGIPAGQYTVVEYSDTRYSNLTQSGFWYDGKNYRDVTVVGGQTKTLGSDPFINIPIEADISKKFSGVAVTDKDYQGLSFKVKILNGEHAGKYIAFSNPKYVQPDPKDAYNEVIYNYANIVNEASATSLKFKNKDSVIRMIYLPMSDSKHNLIQYQVIETNDGSGNPANATGSWFKANNPQFTLMSSTGSVSDIYGPVQAVENNTPKPGQLQITKTLWYDDSTGEVPLTDDHVVYVDNKRVSLQDIYDALTFSVTNLSGNKKVSVYCVDSASGIYSVVDGETTGNTTIKLGTKSHTATIIDLTYGTYRVDETNSAGLSAKQSTFIKTVSKNNITTPAKVAFKNVYKNTTSLRVVKDFATAAKPNDANTKMIVDGTLVSVPDYYLSFTHFCIKKAGSNEYVRFKTKKELDEEGIPYESGKYYFKEFATFDADGDFNKLTSAKDVSKFSLNAEKTEDDENSTIYSFEVVGLPISQSASLYEVIEIMDKNAPAHQVFVCANATDASDDSQNNIQKVAVMIPKNTSVNAEFVNVIRTSDLEIIKEAEDNDIAGKTFDVQGFYMDGDQKKVIAEYKDVKTETKTDSNGKKYGYVKLDNLQYTAFVTTANGSVTTVPVQYTITETNVAQRYKQPAPQTIELGKNGGSVTFVNQLKRATLNIKKTKNTNDGQTNVPFEGIEFQLTNNYDSTVLKGTTNSKGELSFENLIARKYDEAQGKVIDIKYTLKELKGTNNTHFILAADQSFTFNVTRNQWTKTMELANTEESGSFMLSKVNADTEEKIVDAEFTVQRINDKGELIGEPITLIQGTTSDETNQEVPNGVYSIDKLSMGKYVLTETKTPDGFYKIANNNTFELTHNGQLIVAYTDKNGTVKFVDSEDEAYQKYLADSAADPDNTELDFVYYNFPIKVNIKVYKENANKEREYLSGASFVMCEDLNGDGKWNSGEGRIASQGGVLKEGKASDGTPIYTINNLTIGNYYIVERAAPEGFQKEKEYTAVIIDSTKLKELGVDGVFETVPVKNKEIVISIKNKPIFGSLRFIKFNAKTNEYLTGANFTLYVDDGDGIYDAEKDLPYDNNALIASNDVPANATVITNGNVPESSQAGVFEISGLPYGKYIIKETTPPVGFKANPNDYPFSITQQGQKASVYDVQKTEDDELVGAGGQTVPVGITDTEGNVIEPAIANVPISANVSIYKYFFKDVSEIKDKTITLVDKNYNVVATATVEGTVAKFGNVKKGTYQMIVDGNAENSYSTVILSQTSDVTIDLKQVKTPLANATFTLYDSDNNVEQVRKSNAKGQVTFKEVGFGQHTIKETSAPEYYDASKEKFTFDVNKDQTFYFEAENKPSERPLVIKKESEDNVIENILFHVTGTTVFGQEVKFDARTDAKGYINKNVVPGTYIVTEDEKECADRYVYPAPQTIEVTLNHSDAEPAYVTVQNIIKKGSVDTIKVDAEHPEVKLSGAEFTIFSKDGKTAIGKLTEKTNDLGHYVYDGKLNYGDYILRETKAPEKYVLDSKDYPFAIREDGKTERVQTEFDNNIPNTKIRGGVDTYKVDPEHPDKRVSGAEFTVFTTDGKKVTALNESANKPGYYIVKGIEAGKYYVQETKAPEGYLLNSKHYDFEIKKNNVVVHAGSEFKTENETIIGIPDDEIKGTVVVTKVDEEYPENKLSGAKFIVTKTDEARTKVGNLEEVETGIYKLSDLPYGDYYLKETEAPEGFLLDESEHAFQIRENGKEVSVETEAGKGLFNTPIYGSLSIVKIDGENKQPLAGAVFAVFNSDGKELARETTGEDGKIDFGKFRYGKYTIREISAPTDYQPIDEVFDFEIITNDLEVQKIIPNSPNTGDLKVEKWAEDKVIKGIQFRVTGEPIEGYKVDEVITTGEDGFAYLKGLVVGEYTVEELNQEDRYLPVPPQTVTIVADTTADVNIDDVDYEPNDPEIIEDPEDEMPDPYMAALRITTVDDTDVKPIGQEPEEPENPEEPTDTPEEPEKNYLLFENILKKGYVQVTKVDEAYPDNKLTGAEFTIYSDVNGNGEFDEDEDAEIGKLTEIEEGIYKSDILVYGTYLLKETKAPKFYEGDDNYYAFAIVEDGKTVEVTNVEAEVKDDVDVDEDGQVTDAETDEIEKNAVYFVNKRIPTDVVITKSDVSTGELIPDCKIQILDENKNVLIEDKTNKDGEVWFKLLPGIYYYREFEAPVGYILDETPYQFEVKDTDEIVKCEMTNKLKEVDVLITKTDVSTGALLADCKMQILDENQKVIFEGTTDKNGEVWFKLLPGIYYYREYQAPVGYILDDTPYKFEVKRGDEIVKCEMTNTPAPTPDIPKTGETAAVTAILLALMMSGMAIVVLKKKRTSK